MAALEDTSLYHELQTVIADGPKPVHYQWRAEIHTPQETIVPQTVVGLDFMRDYDQVYADQVQLEVMLPRGTYVHRIIPESDNLTATLQKIPVGEGNDVVDLDRPLITATMRAVLADEFSHPIENNHEQLTDPEVSDLGGIVKVRFQLLDLAIERLRMKTIGGVFQDAIPADVLHALLTRAVRNLNLPEESRIRGVDIVPPNNATPRKHVIVPHGTKINRLPSYIQEECGGVYGAGLGHYLQRGIWYVYPEFDLTRFDKTSRALTIVNIPPHRVPGIERTYTVEGDKLLVLSTGRVRYRDDSEQLQLNYGNGVRFANAERILEGFANSSGNKAVAVRDENVAEFVAQPRRTGLNQVQFSDRRITANPYRETSMLSRRLGSHLTVIWENSDGDLIYPGMPVRVLYTASDEVLVAQGVVLRAHTFIAAVGSGLAISRHAATTHLTLFIEKPNSQAR